MATALKASSSRSVAAQRLGARRSTAARRSAAVSRRQVTVKAQGQAFDRNWLNPDPLVAALGFAGWTVPSNIPVSAFGGNSLFGLLCGSIGDNLAHFPTGPALDDKFWLYLITWHVGLFLTLTLGQVGVQGRKQGYW